MNINFEKANLNHIDIIFSWLKEPHIEECWDNTQGHKDDIIKFVNGRKEASDYCDGLYTYWIGLIDKEPYCMLMTIPEAPSTTYDAPELKKRHLSKQGATYGMDFMIGNIVYFGKGLGAKTLKDFIDYFRKNYDAKADSFFIDPDSANPKARHVYEKAGFKYVGDFMMQGNVSGAGKLHHLLVLKMEPNHETT